MKRLITILAIINITAFGLFLMSEEITVTALLKLDNGPAQLQRNVSNFQVAQAGRSYDFHIQEINTNAHELITVISDVATNGFAWFRNVTTNEDRYIQIGIDVSGGFYPFARLKAEEFGVIRLSVTNAIYARTIYIGTNTTISADLESGILED